MKIYTRGGDGGETSLFGGHRVRKDAARIEAYGDVDELNATIGTASSVLIDEELRRQLGEVQRWLFDLGAELATPEAAQREQRGEVVVRVPAAACEQLEAWIDAFDEELPALTAFVLPGGTHAAALLHQARTVCRRAERRIVSLAEGEPVTEDVLRFVNRLSDYLFTAARIANHRSGVVEHTWLGRER